MVQTVPPIPPIPLRRLVGRWLRRHWFVLWVNACLSLIVGFLSFWIYWNLFSQPFCWR